MMVAVGGGGKGRRSGIRSGIVDDGNGGGMCATNEYAAEQARLDDAPITKRLGISAQKDGALRRCYDRYGDLSSFKSAGARG